MSERDWHVSALDVRDDLLELAERYETVAAIDVTQESPAGRSAMGPRIPPGMQEVLDADEILQALAAIDDWAEFTAHVAMDECDAAVPETTPARLRAVAEHSQHFADHDDELFALSFLDDLHDHLRAMRRLSSRGVRRIRTGMRCPKCDHGRLYSPLGEGDRGDDSLHCDKDPRHVVPYSVWSSWPRARIRFITPEHAARLLETTVNAVRIRAHRHRWRRVGTGRDVRYHVDDVRGDTPERAEA